MQITVTPKKSRDNKKIWYYYESGKEKGQRWAAKIWTYTKPATTLEKEWNKTQLAILERTRLQLMLNAVTPKLKTDFLLYYKNFVTDNARTGDRHLKASLDQFKLFVAAKKIAPDELTEENCLSFRRWLLDSFNGETPQNYFSCFKRVVKLAHKAGYFPTNLTEDIKGKKNPTVPREFLTGDEYLQLTSTPCPNAEVFRAAITSLYTGLAFCDVQALNYSQIKNGFIHIARKKTGVPGRIPIHESLKKVLLTGKGAVFNLPTQDGSNKILKQWVLNAGIDKHITWHCLRLSFSVDLLRKGVEQSTVAGLMLHTSTNMVGKIYRRYMDKDGEEAIKKLPG